MLTRLLEHVEPLPDDSVILRSLDSATQADVTIGMNCPMGIRNSHGHVYRLVQAQNLGEAVRLVRAMQMLGFTEEDRRSPAEGCNSTFYRHYHTRH